MKTNRTVFHLGLLALTALLGFATVGTTHAQQSDYYGEVPVELDKDKSAPKTPVPDPFGNPLFVDGNTDKPLDSRSMAAFEIEKQKKMEETRQLVDRSIRADIGTGQPITVLIAPEHFVQLTFMRNGEVVFPRRAFTGQPALLHIDKKDNSPYVYIAASAMVEGQTTNLFVETEEDQRVQTYVVKLMVTEPKNIREQVAVNLVADHTPPIRGITPRDDSAIVGSITPPEGGAAGGPAGAPGQAGPPAAGPIGSAIPGKFTPDQVKQYLNTMIEMAEHYNDAKTIERNSGRVIYKDQDIKGFPSGQFNYIDPVENTSWMVHQVWFFPRYDAILLDVRCHNPNSRISMWDYSQMKWQANRSPVHFTSTAAAPEAMQTSAKRTNRIWYLVQGNRLDPEAEFSPVFPRADRRGNGGIQNGPASSK